MQKRWVCIKCFIYKTLDVDKQKEFKLNSSAWYCFNSHIIIIFVLHNNTQQFSVETIEIEFNLML